MFMIPLILFLASVEAKRTTTMDDVADCINDGIDRCTTMSALTACTSCQGGRRTFDIERTCCGRKISELLKVGGSVTDKCVTPEITKLKDFNIEAAKCMERGSSQCVSVMMNLYELGVAYVKAVGSSGGLDGLGRRKRAKCADDSMNDDQDDRRHLQPGVKPLKLMAQLKKADEVAPCAMDCVLREVKKCERSCDEPSDADKEAAWNCAIQQDMPSVGKAKGCLQESMGSLLGNGGNIMDMLGSGGNVGGFIPIEDIVDQAVNDNSAIPGAPAVAQQAADDSAGRYTGRFIGDGRG